MWILPLVGYSGLIFGFCFLTLAIASGLFYLSELVEEHTVLAKKLITRLIYTVIAIQVLLCLLDGFPFKLTVLSVVSHLVYSQNLRHFPIVKLKDPFFILSIVLVLANHHFWFSYLQRPAHSRNSPHDPHYRPYNPYDTSQPIPPSFNEIASFFGICVWLVPFSLFVALSAGDNVLPSMGSEYATGEGSSFLSPGQEPGGTIGESGKGKGKASNGSSMGMAKALIGGVREWVSETVDIVKSGRRVPPLGGGKKF